MQGEQSILVEPAADRLPAGPARDGAERHGLILVRRVRVDALTCCEPDGPASDAAVGRPLGDEVSLDPGWIIEHACLVLKVGGVQLAAELAIDANEEIAVES